MQVSKVKPKFLDVSNFTFNRIIGRTSWHRVIPKKKYHGKLRFERFLQFFPLKHKVEVFKFLLYLSFE